MQLTYKGCDQILHKSHRLLRHAYRTAIRTVELVGNRCAPQNAPAGNFIGAVSDLCLLASVVHVATGRSTKHYELKPA